MTTHRYVQDYAKKFSTPWSPVKPRRVSIWKSAFLFITYLSLAVTAQCVIAKLF